jgi:hypothetical protein
MTNSESALLVILVYSGMMLFTAVSYAVFVTYLILRKYSDFGDSSCKIDEYSQRGIGYYRAVDDAPAMEKRFLFTEYGANPYESNVHSIPEVLLKNSGEKTIEEP